MIVAARMVLYLDSELSYCVMSVLSWQTLHTIQQYQRRSNMVFVVIAFVIFGLMAIAGFIDINELNRRAMEEDKKTASKKARYRLPYELWL